MGAPLFLLLRRGILAARQPVPGCPHGNFSLPVQEVSVARVESLNHPGEKFILRLRMCILSLRMCISNLKMYILSLKIKNLHG